MKKILNEPLAYVDEMLEGMCDAHPAHYERCGPENRVIVRPGSPVEGKVGLVSGGGSGHLPVFTGYVGDGLLDACAIGDVFSSPNVEQMAEATRRANGGKGVLAPLRQLQWRQYEFRYGRRNARNGGYRNPHRARV